MTTKTLPATEPAADQPSHNGAELLAMARMLRRSRGTFLLAFARCNSTPQREALVAQIKDAVEPFGVKPIELMLTSDDLNALPERLQAAASDGQPLFVYGLDQVMPSAHPDAALAQLNHRRAKFGHIESPVILWVPEYVMRLIAQHAPDFWSWRSGVYDFEPEAEISTPLYQREMKVPYHVMTSLDRADKEQRLHLLMGLLDDYEGEDSALGHIRSNILFKIAGIQTELGNYETAENYYKQCLKIAHSLKDQRDIAIIQGELADLYQLRGDIQQAERLYKQSLVIKLNLGDQLAVARTQGQLADLYVDSGKYEKAERLYQQSLDTAYELDRRRDIAVTQHSLANLYVHRGDYKQAELLYQQSLEIARELDDKLGIAATLNGLAGLYQLQADYEEAEQMYKQSLKIVLELGNRREAAIIQHRLADFYRQRGDHEQAEQLYWQSLELFRELDLGRHVAVTQHQLASLYRQHGDYEQATRLYQASLETSAELGEQRNVAIVLHNWAMMEKKRGNRAAAIDLLTRSRQIYAELGLKGEATKEDAEIFNLKHNTDVGK